MTKFDERESIHYEMEFLKEQSRQDFQLYFELRTQRSKRFEELQERLREIDNLEYERSRQPIQPPKVEPRKELFSDLTKEQQIVDKIKPRKGLLKSTLVTETIVTFLKHQDKPVTPFEIREMLIRELDKEYVNMTTVMQKAQNMDIGITKIKEGGQVTYTYRV